MIAARSTYDECFAVVYYRQELCALLFKHNEARPYPAFHCTLNRYHKRAMCIYILCTKELELHNEVCRR